MNKSALRSFATNARRELLNKVKAKAMKIGITEEKIKKADVESSDAIFIDGRQLSSEEKTQRQNLIKRIEQKGFNQVMEEVAYTWFNRFTALRFMEVNEYLPSNVRVLSSANPEDPIPDIIKEAMSIDFDIDKEWVYERKVKNENEKLFQYLIIKQCNELYDYLPFMFEKIDDFTEILFPEGLLSKDAFIKEMTNTHLIPEENWSNVEIIGWLYQYYIAEEKDRVFKAKKKYKSEEIPFATQLFTPDWIVRYMVQNSLGRYWVESHPEDKDLINKWEFYLKKSNQETDFEEKIAPYINKELKVEDIKCFDPAMGSGHILIYLFDVLYEIYSRCGYLEREIPQLIIENNLFGLDIDDRAYQLASFSIVMKALEYNRRFLRTIKKNKITLNLASIQESNLLNKNDISYLAGDSSGENFDLTKEFLDQFHHAKSIGSLIKISSFPKNFLDARLRFIYNSPTDDLFMDQSRDRVVTLLPLLIKQAEIMSKQYDILVTNPPYMGYRNMNKELTEFVKQNYAESKGDLFACFMEVNHYLKKSSFYASINQHSWMFLSSFNKLRTKTINEKSIDSMLHLGSRAFEEIGGEVVQSTAFVLRNNYAPEIKGVYVRLTDNKGAIEKKKYTLKATKNPSVSYRYLFDQRDFNKIAGSPIAYWISESMLKVYEDPDCVPLGDISRPRVGQNTGDNKRFLRLWHEVNFNKITFDLEHENLENRVYKWLPYNKGGTFRKWYGNQEYIINWENNGKEIKEYAVKRNNGKHWSRYIQNVDYICKPGITWTFISSSNFSMRYLPTGFICDVAGSAIYPNEDVNNFLHGFLNTNLTFNLLKMQNPTLNFQASNISGLPFKKEILNNEKVGNLVQQNISISKEDWDSFETSWNFTKHPLIRFKDVSGMIEKAHNNWKEYTDRQFQHMKSNEEELNDIYNTLYGLQDEVSIEVQDENISINKANLERETKSFISYAVGCLFGRYSLDEEGIVCSNGTIETDEYKTFPADQDNILPVLIGSYFEDDIVSRFIDFVKVTFGKQTLEENLNFIADILGKKKNETAKETIRRYFLNDFFKNHVQIYKKRPIYWLFTSGKQKAFNCLIYIHRYDSTTLGRIRTDYLHELQTRMDAEKESLINIIDGDSTSKEINQAKKELTSLEKKVEELKDYDEVLHHMADQQIKIDLDDGVEVNYGKFKGLVAKI